MFSFSSVVLAEFAEQDGGAKIELGTYGGISGMIGYIWSVGWSWEDHRVGHEVNLKFSENLPNQ